MVMRSPDSCHVRMPPLDLSYLTIPGVELLIRGFLITTASISIREVGVGMLMLMLMLMLTPISTSYSAYLSD
jgi:hypothetical protein